MLRSPVVSMSFALFSALLAVLSLSGARVRSQADIPVNIVPIYAIQGPGSETPLAEQWVDTYGVVTGVTATGFYLQDPIGDGDPRTSDGLFIYTRTRPNLSAGECVAVRRGFVDEFYEKTELSRVREPEPVDYCRTVDLVPAVVEPAQPGLNPEVRFEHVEGMLVRVDDLVGTVQGATKRFGNGDVEIAFLPDPWPAATPGGRVFQADGAHMQGLMYLSGSFGAELPELNWGDRIGLGAAPGDADAVVAVLDYNFGKYQLIPLPGQAISGTVMAEQPVGPFLPAAQPDEITLCSVNLWGLGRGIDQFPAAMEYALQLQKRAHAVATALNGCMIVALQEAGSPEDAENLATVLRNRYGLDYEATAVPGPGTISSEFPLTNALLTRRDRVAVTNVTLAQGCSVTDYGVAPILDACPNGRFPLFNRPPLVVDLAIQGAWEQPYALTVINNHWKSKGGDETVNVVRRTAQAAHVASLVQARVDADPTARILVVGDLNDYYASAPVETLRENVTPELVHLYDMLPPMARYTYVFNGGSQVLDHMVATANIVRDVAAIEPIRINADYAYPERVDVTTVHHASDHDPVALTLRPGRAAWVGGHLRVPGIQVLLRTADGTIVDETVTDPQGDFRLWRVAPGRYDLGLDGPSALRIEPAEQPITVPVGAGAIVTVTVGHRAVEAAAAGVRLAPLLEEADPPAPKR